MSALAIEPWRQMLLVAGIRQGRQRWRWLAGFVVICILIVPLAVVALSLPSHLWQALLVASSALLVIMWSLVSSSLLRQNHPHVARLVPGHVWRLRRLFLWSWAAVVVLCGLLMGTALGHGPQWALVAAVLLLFVAWSTAWPQYVWLAWVAWFLLLPFTPLRQFVPTVAGLRSLAPESLGSLALLMLGVAWLSSRWLLGRGGHWHRKRYAVGRRLDNAQQLALNGSASAPTSAFWSALDRRFRWGYHAWLARVVRRPSSVRARLALVFGPQLHWASIVCTATMIGAVGMMALVLLVPASSAADATGALPGLGFGLLMTSAGLVAGLRLALYQSRREQALVMLAPGLPRGTELNRWLVRRLVAHYLLVAAVIVGLALPAVAWLFGTSASATAVGIFGAYLAIAVPAGLPLLARDWARLGPPETWSVLLVMAAAALIGLVVLVLVVKLDAPPAAIAGVGLPLMAAAGLWCWRRAQQLPPMLPVAHRPARGF